MDFAFTEEQVLLRNSVERFISERYDFETRQASIASETGWRPDYWQQFADLGLLAASFPEELGGLGGSALESMIIMEEFGKALVVEPYIPTVILCGGAIRHAGTAAQKEELLGRIISGDLVMAFAFAEPKSRYDLFDVAVSARKAGGGYALSGQKSVVIGAPWAEKLLVTARTSGNQRDERGITLFVIDKSAPGVTTRDYTTVDGLKAGEVIFDNVQVSSDAVLGDVGNGLSLTERVIDEGIAALCAEASGNMKVLTNLTVDFSRTRQQFGVPIGKFQVLQHRMVDMFMHAEQSLSMTYMATLNLGLPAPVRRKAVSGAKVYICKAARFVGQQAVQTHGGMGMTDELNVGHYFKRLSMINVMFGDTDFHMRRFIGVQKAA